MAKDIPLSGIVLCGGLSLRMGEPKATLRFGSETLVERLVRIVAQATNEVIVVAAVGQALPAFGDRVRVVHDAREGRGPLEGLRAGLAALSHEEGAAFVTCCDAPFLRPGLIDRLAQLLEQYDAAAPWVGERFHPLTALYRRRVLPEVDRMLADDVLRVATLLARVDTRRVTADELRDADPALDSLRNVNRPEEYRAALAELD